HLNVVPLLSVAFLFAQLGRVIRSRTSGHDGLRSWVPGASRAALFGTGLVLLTVLPLAALRAYQASRLRQALASRLAARREPVSLTRKLLGDGRILYETDALPARQAAARHLGTVTSEYLVVRLGGDSCTAFGLPLTTRYEPTGRSDFSRTI